MLQGRPYQAGIVWVGHVAPALLLLAAAVRPGWGAAPAMVAGAAMLAGGLIAKDALIRKAGFLVDLYENFGQPPAGAPSAAAPAASPAAAAA